MELKNKIDWQAKNLKECGLKIEAVGRNEFHITAVDTQNFVYYWTKKEPKTFLNTSKNGKNYKVIAWKFDNVSKWVSIPEFKKIMVDNYYLISLDRNYTKTELIKELDDAAAGYDDVEPFIMKDDIYIASVASHNKDITKLNDAIAKNNDELDDEAKEAVLKANKEKRITAKIEHKAKMEKLFDNIDNLLKEELIKKINNLHNTIASEKLNGEEIINQLENELTINEIETYLDRIIEQNFEKRFVTNSLLIYLIKTISQIAKSKILKLTLKERNLKIDKFLLDSYNEIISDWNKAVNDKLDCSDKANFEN